MNGGMKGLVGLRAFGIAIIALAVIYAVIYYGGRDSQSDTPSQPIPIADIGGGSTPTARSAETPRAAADQLFNQAMMAVETGESAAAAQYVPMAIAAYRQLDNLDPDGRYHIALLSLSVERPEDALAQADTILAVVPDHLLALAVSARAYDMLGQTDKAVEYFQLFIDAYTTERAASRQEYIDHTRTLTARLDLARSYIQEHGGTR